MTQTRLASAAQIIINFADIHFFKSECYSTVDRYGFIAVLIALMSKQQALITALKQQSYLEDNILATESSINQFTFRWRAARFLDRNYTILKRELQVTVQGISEYLRSSAGQAISPTVLSGETYVAKGLNSASARQVAQTTLDLLYTLIELPTDDATQRIQQQFSLLPMVNAMQAEENARYCVFRRCAIRCFSLLF